MKAIHKKLVTYMGITVRYFEIKVEVREEYVKKVAKNDPVAREELNTMVQYRDRYALCYSRFDENTEDPEY